MNEKRPRATRPQLFVVLLVAPLVCGCRQPAARRTEQTANRSAPSDAPPAKTAPSDATAARPANRQILDTIFGRTTGSSRPLPPGLVVGGDCPPVDGPADEEIAAQAAAPVPLTAGLTLTDKWTRNSKDGDYECLTQVTKIDRDGVEISLECNSPDSPGMINRRICRSDLRTARILHSGAGGVVIESAAGALPETIVGATQFSLSAAQMAELRQTGSTRSHYVQRNSLETIDAEAESVLHADGRGTRSVLVNDRPMNVPVVLASGDADIWYRGRSAKGRLTAAILDDDRFPMLVDYLLTDDNSEKGFGVFRLNFSKITYPRGHDMEEELAKDKRAVVYGIYFDFASDRIRPQSEPVLKEISEVLSRNPDWRLSIEGHTDSIGGDASNLELSRRRSAAVRSALVERYHVAPDRLTTSGYGAAVPKDTNQTPEGRAKNRRVELVRQ